jgi:hypothetical protein
MKSLVKKIAERFYGKEVKLDRDIIPERKPDKERLKNLNFGEFIFRSGVRMLELDISKASVKAFIASHLKKRAGIKDKFDEKLYYHAPVGYPKGYIASLNESVAENIKQSPAMVVIPLFNYDRFNAVVVELMREKIKEHLEDKPHLVEELSLGREPLKPQILKKTLFEMSPPEREYFGVLSKAIDDVAEEIAYILKKTVDMYNNEEPKMERERTMSEQLRELFSHIVPSVADELENIHPKALEMLVSKIERSFEVDRQLQNRILMQPDNTQINGIAFSP